MIRSFIVGCKCAGCRAHGRHRVGYRLIVRNAKRRLRRKAAQLIRQKRFDDIAKVSFGWPG